MTNKTGCCPDHPGDRCGRASCKIDAPRLMPLGADHVQVRPAPSQLRTVLLHPLFTAFDLIDQLNPILCAGTSSRVVYSGPEARAQVMVSALPPNTISVPRPAMLVARVNGA